MISKDDVFIQLHEPVSVCVQFDDRKPRIRKLSLVWKGEEYHFFRINGYEQCSVGDELVHKLSVSGYKKSFTLCLHTKSLRWFVEEVYERYQRSSKPQTKRLARGLSLIKSVYSQPPRHGQKKQSRR